MYDHVQGLLIVVYTRLLYIKVYVYIGLCCSDKQVFRIMYAGCKDRCIHWALVYVDVCICRAFM